MLRRFQLSTPVVSSSSTVVAAGFLKHQFNFNSSSSSSKTATATRSRTDVNKTSKAAVDALRRSAEMDTGEYARKGAAAIAEAEKKRLAGVQPVLDEKKPPQNMDIDGDRGGFNLLNEAEHTSEFIGFMRKDVKDDQQLPQHAKNLPCDQAGSAEEEAAGGGAGGGAQQQPNKKKQSKNTSSKEEAPAAPEAQFDDGAPESSGRLSKPVPLTRQVEFGTDGSAETPKTAASGAPNWQDKKKLWKEMKKKQTDFLSDHIDIPKVNELEYMRLEKELKQEDRFHWRLGQMAIDDEQLRNDYYALHILCMKLNKTRWYMMDIANKRGTSTTAIGMRGVFWKESCHAIIEAGRMTRGQFVDSHPVLRPFGEAMQRRHFTKAFCRGFVDAHLKILPQPANMKQLYDHFDRFHGHFLCMQLELLGVKSEVAEHIMIHLGRAIGVTQHCVMLWREYARFGHTMLPADICAANHVNLSLLRNLRLATVDRCVRHVLFEVMNHVRGEMKHVQDLVPLYPTAGWPLLIEAFYPLYFLGFLEHFQFDITKRMADQVQYTYGFYWYMNKQMLRWQRTQDLSVLVDPNPPHFLSPKMWSKKSNVDEDKVKEAAKVHEQCGEYSSAYR